MNRAHFCDRSPAAGACLESPARHRRPRPSAHRRPTRVARRSTSRSMPATRSSAAAGAHPAAGSKPTRSPPNKGHTPGRRRQKANAGVSVNVTAGVAIWPWRQLARVIVRPGGKAFKQCQPKTLLSPQLASADRRPSCVVAVGRSVSESVSDARATAAATHIMPLLDLGFVDPSC